MRYSTDIVVLDLEATSPEMDGNTIERSNIIDIGAVRLDRRTLVVLDEFDELVRPTDFEIAPHITELTGITPEMVVGRDGFREAGGRFAEWCGPRNRFVLAVWGAYYDIPLLRRECSAHGIDYRAHFVGGALDVRSLAVGWLAENHHDTTGVTVARVLEKMGIAHEFRFHRALDDARAEAMILRHVHRAEEPLSGLPSA
jgi:DNA polymerase III epsilon subunit-like protein